MRVEGGAAGVAWWCSWCPWPGRAQGGCQTKARTRFRVVQVLVVELSVVIVIEQAMHTVRSLDTVLQQMRVDRGPSSQCGLHCTRCAGDCQLQTRHTAASPPGA